ncbi:MAG: ABC transporter ATP-binding protein, partial [Fusobacteriia bacterium 4572_132]
MNSIAVQNLSKSYKNTKVVSDVSLEVKKGEIVGLLGPNGAGKTTTFYMIVGIIKPNDGKVLYNERDITKFPMHKRASLGMGYLAQEASVFRNLTVEENLEAILEMKNYNKKKIKKIKDEILEEFKITHIAKNLGYSLSGGER